MSSTTSKKLPSSVRRSGTYRMQTGKQSGIPAWHMQSCLLFQSNINLMITSPGNDSEDILFFLFCFFAWCTELKRFQANAGWKRELNEYEGYQEHGEQVGDKPQEDSMQEGTLLSGVSWFLRSYFLKFFLFPSQWAKKFCISCGRVMYGGERKVILTSS